MSRNLIELIRALNESEQFKSPKKGFLIQNEKCSGLNCLNDGTKKLIAIADTFHDFSHLQKSNLFSNWTYKPGNNLLRKWALNIIRDIDISKKTEDEFNKQTIINTIFSNPEEFVYLYLYWNDFFYYKKGSDIEDIKEIDANTNIIILDMPNNCGNNEEDIKEKSKEIVKNYFEKIQNNSEFKFKNSGKIKENDLAYTMDQGGKDEIFTSGNFWKIQGLAWAYDNSQQIDYDELKELYENSFDRLAYDTKNLNLNEGEAMLGIEEIKFFEEYFQWIKNQTGKKIEYNMRNKRNLKNIIQHIISYQNENINNTSLFASILTIAKNLVNFFKDLWPDIDKSNSVNKEISILTDFKRIGDYIQCKEVNKIQAFKKNKIPLVTIDGICACISHKVFGNYTIWQKPQTNNRCAIQLLMIPFKEDDNTYIESNTIKSNTIDFYKDCIQDKCLGQNRIGGGKDIITSFNTNEKPTSSNTKINNYDYYSLGYNYYKFFKPYYKKLNNIIDKLEKDLLRLKLEYDATYNNNYDLNKLREFINNKVEKNNQKLNSDFDYSRTTINKENDPRQNSYIIQSQLKNPEKNNSIVKKRKIVPFSAVSRQGIRGGEKRKREDYEDNENLIDILYNYLNNKAYNNDYYNRDKYIIDLFKNPKNNIKMLKTFIKTFDNCDKEPTRIDDSKTENFNYLNNSFIVIDHLGDMYRKLERKKSSASKVPKQMIGGKYSKKVNEYLRKIEILKVNIKLSKKDKEVVKLKKQLVNTNEKLKKEKDKVKQKLKKVKEKQKLKKEKEKQKLKLKK